jgi:hypothetical protein
VGKATGSVRAKRNRLLVEAPLPQDGRERGGAGLRRGPAKRPAVRSVTVNLAEAPLGWLKSRGHISERLFAAGELLRKDWEQAQLGPRVTMQWDAPPIGRTPRSAPDRGAKSERALSAKRRFEVALEAVGPGLSDVLWRVACSGEGMRECETALGWPARAGKVVLTLALERLADHYRLR